MLERGEADRQVSGDSKKGIKEEVRVIRLPGGRLGEAAGVLARVFHDNPNFVDLFPAERVRARALGRLQTAGLRDALGFGHVYAAVRGPMGSGSEELVGVAAWLPPGGFPLSPWRKVRALPDMVSILAATPRSSLRLLRYTDRLTRLHPAQPYWYLQVVGVDPAARGLGIGTRLVEPVLALADEAGEPCYLETMTERNVGWYQSLGFEVRDAGVRFVPGGPPNWTMIRPPTR